LPLCFSFLELTEITALSDRNGRLGIAVKKVRQTVLVEVMVVVVAVVTIVPRQQA
jgi:hypothetical protein